MSTGSEFRRYAVAALVVCFGAGASMAVFTAVRQRERDRARLGFEAVAGSMAAAIGVKIKENIDALHTIRSFYDASPSIDPARFRSIARAAISRNQSLQALEWAPWVPASERDAYEAAGRRRSGSDFQFTERSAPGTMVRATSRPEYVPVYFVEPLRGNETALGFDLASNPTRQEAIERARNTGEAAATARVRLVQETGEQSGFLIVLPVYRPGTPPDNMDERRRTVRGYLLGVFRIADMVSAALDGLTVEGVSLAIDDVTGPEPAAHLLLEGPGANARDAHTSAAFEWRTTLDVAGRRWALTFRPAAGYLAARRTGHEWSFLTAGLLLAGLLGASLVISARRSAALARINARLAGEVAERTRAEENADRRRRESEIVGALARTINASLDLETLLPMIAESARDLCGSDAAAIALREGESGSIVLRYSAGHDFGRLAGVRIEPGKGAAGQVLQSGRPFRTDSYSSDSRITKDYLPLMMELGIEAMLAVPISAHARVEGVLFVTNLVPRPFTERDETTLSRLADHAAVAIQNARLHGETRQKLAETETLLAVSQDVTSTLDAAEMMRRVARTAALALGADMGGAYLVDAEQRSLQPVAGYHVPKHLLRDFLTFPIPLKGHPVLEQAWDRRQAVWSSDVAGDPRLDQDSIRRFPHRSLLFCPTVVQGAPIGGLFLTWFEHEHRCTAAELQLIEGISRHAGVALANARLVDELKSRHARLEALLDVTRQVSRIQPVDALLKGIAEACGRLIHGDSGGIRLLEGDELVLIGVWGESASVTGKPRVKVGESISGRAALTGEPLVVSDPENDPRVIPEHREQLRGLGYRAWLAVPIKMGERLVGVLSIRTKRAGGFSAEDLTISTAFASQAAVTLENARLYQEVTRAYDELSQAQDQLTQAQRMEAVGRLAGGVAHDFNNLLTVITGHAHLLLQDLDPTSPVRPKIELIRATANRAAALTRQLLAFSRKQVLEPAVLDLTAIVTGLTSMLQRLIGEDVEFAIMPGTGACHVLADQGQLEQVLANLVVNARDAMPHGGRLTIHTARVELDQTFVARHPEVRPGPHVMLAVSDTGAGMSPDVQARIFEPFFTTKEVGKGTGLGLSTVYGIVRQHEGSITVESELGRGSTFRIYLPRVAHAGEPAPAAAVAPAEPPRGTETVLLVEDEGEVRALARDVLAMTGYTVLEALDGHAALRIAQQEAGHIHLLLTDVVMPGMNGREVADYLGKSHPETRVLYMSGYTDDTISHHGVLSPGTALLSKPFTPDGLARKVREVLDASVTALA